MPRRLRLLALAVLPFSLVGCDALADVVGLDQVDVSTGDAASLTLAPNQAVLASSSVHVSQSLPDLFDVESITVPEGAISYTPAEPLQPTAPGLAHAGAACTVAGTILIDGIPAAQGSVVLDESAPEPVQSYSFVYASGYDREAICAALPEGTECPVTTAQYGPEEIRRLVDDALKSGRFDLALVADNPSDCAGTLQIARLRFGLDY